MENNKIPIDLVQPEVSVSSNGSYHVQVKDILKSQNGKRLIKEISELNLIKKTNGQ